MNGFNAILLEAWQYKLSVFPILFTYIIFELSSIVRKLTRIAYTPIYFMFFPLGYSDELYATYFNEDDFYGIGERQTAMDKVRLRKRIISISTLSMIISTVFNPALAGAFAALFLSVDQFREFVLILLVVKIIQLSKSLYSVRHQSFVDKSGAFGWIVLIYIVYVIIIFTVLRQTFWWTSAQISSLGLVGALDKMLNYVIVDMTIYILMVASISAAISYWMTDPKIISDKLRFDDPVVDENES